MANKYELTDHTKVVNGHTLHQIKALKDFSNVKKDDLGGWIEDYRNLSQSGNAWIYDDAQVLDYAFVSDNASIEGHASIESDADVFSNAKVFGKAVIDFTEGLR